MPCHRLMAYHSENRLSEKCQEFYFNKTGLAMNNPSLARPNILMPILGLVWLGHFFVDVMIGIWPVYKSLAQIDLAQAGLIAAGGAFIGEGSQLFFGSLSDKGYRHICIMLGIFMAAAAIFLSYTTSIALLFILFMVTCIGSGCFHPSAASLVNTMIPSKRNILMTVFASGGSLGLACSQLIFMKTYYGTDGQTIWLAAPIVLLVIGLLFFWPAKENNGMVYHKNPKPKIKEYLSFFKHPILRSLYLSQVANQSLYWGMIFILPDVLKTFSYPNWICYGVGHFCFILGGALMMIPGGYLADRYSPRTLMLVLGVLGMVCFYTVLLFGAFSMWLVLPVLVVLGPCLAVMNPVAVSFGVKLVPHSPGAVSAFLMGLVWCISEALGPGGVGIMSKFFTDYAPVKALAILGMLFIVQIYHTMLLPKEEVVLLEPQVSLEHIA